MRMEIFIVIGIVAGAVLVLLYFKLKSWLEKYRTEKKFKRSIKKEEEAYHFLKKNGYEIIEYQPQLCYNVYVDEESYTVNITPDYFVKKDGKRYVAEVKTGEYAPDISSRNTRRQLLEYYIASRFEGILLVDMEKMKIMNIEFDILKFVKKSNNIWKNSLIGMLLLVIAILLCILYMATNNKV